MGRHRNWGTIGGQARATGAYLGEWWAYSLHHYARAAWHVQPA